MTFSLNGAMLAVHLFSAMQALLHPKVCAENAFLDSHMESFS
jgi:hypothetical protein